MASIPTDGRVGNSVLPDRDSVLATDISGSQGYNSSDYTGFSGASAAAPQVAGVIALILERTSINKNITGALRKNNELRHEGRKEMAINIGARIWIGQIA